MSLSKLPLKLQVFSLRHNGDAVIADEPAQKNLVARPRAVGGNGDGVFDNSQSRGGDKHLVALAAVHHFGVARDHGDSGFGGGGLHGAGYPLQVARSGGLLPE